MSSLAKPFESDAGAEPAPPFYANTPDETHCFQASVKMVLDAKAPSLKITLPELFYITGNSGEAATWPLRAATYLANTGFDIYFMDPFSLEDFIQNPEKAMRNFYGDEPTDWQLENSNIQRVVLDAKDFLSNPNISPHFTTPSVLDLARLIKDDYLCICNVNVRTLKNEAGYAGHFVVVYDVDEHSKTLRIQNPGPPSMEEASISFETFDEAWAYSGPEYRNILGIRATEKVGQGIEWLKADLRRYKNFVHHAATNATSTG